MDQSHPLLVHPVTLGPFPLSGLQRSHIIHPGLRDIRDKVVGRCLWSLTDLALIQLYPFQVV